MGLLGKPTILGNPQVNFKPKSLAVFPNRLEMGYIIWTLNGAYVEIKPLLLLEALSFPSLLGREVRKVGAIRVWTSMIITI